MFASRGLGYVWLQYRPFYLKSKEKEPLAKKELEDVVVARGLSKRLLNLSINHFVKRSRKK